MEGLKGQPYYKIEWLKLEHGDKLKGQIENLEGLHTIRRGGTGERGNRGGVGRG